MISWKQWINRSERSCSTEEDHSIHVLRGRVAPRLTHFPEAEEISSPTSASHVYAFHPEVRTRGEKKLLEQLTDGAPEFNSKIVLNALFASWEWGRVRWATAVPLWPHYWNCQSVVLGWAKTPLEFADSRKIRFVILGSSCCVRSIHQTVWL